MRPRCAEQSHFGAGAKAKGLVRWAQAATWQVAAAVFWGKPCNRTFRVLTSGVVADPRGGPSGKDQFDGMLCGRRGQRVDRPEANAPFDEREQPRATLEEGAVV